MSDAVERAVGRFAGGFSCAQAVFSAFASENGLEEDLALSLAAPFGAGFGRLGETCGALSGALLVLGVHYAKSRPDQRDEIYAITREFVEQFRRQNGALVCRELLGLDISTPEGLQAARAANVFDGTCPSIVEKTARSLERFLREHPLN